MIKQKFVGFGGGSERYHTSLVEQLKQRGHEIHVYAARWDQAADAAAIHLHRVPVFGRRTFLGQLSFALNCRKRIAEVPCDVIFSGERTLRQDICRAGGGCHREWILQRRRYSKGVRRATFGLNPLHRSLLWLERQTFAPDNTRLIIANSHRGKEEIIRHYGFPGERIEVIHNGVDCTHFKPTVRVDRNETFELLFVGSGFERKGLKFCLEALTKLPVQVRLLVTGKGNHRPYARMAARLGVADRVEFLGATADIHEVYERGDLLVHPAIYEPFSNACLEAMACGLPVVTSEINGAAEVIVQGKNGVVVRDPSDTGVLAEEIRPFLDRRFREVAGAQARRTAETLPIELNVERTLQLFQRIQSAQA